MVKNIEKYLWDHSLDTMEVLPSVEWLQHIMKYLKNGGTVKPTMFMEDWRSKKIEEYVQKKYFNDYQPDYRNVDIDDHGRCLFVRDFIESVCRQCKLEPDVYLKYLYMAPSNMFNAALIEKYIMMVKDNLELFPWLDDSDRLIVFQIVEGLQPDTFRNHLRLRRRWIDTTGTPAKALKDISDEVVLYRDGLAAIERFGDGGKQKQQQQQQQAGQSKQHCPNCHTHGHTIYDCPEKCSKCPCGMKPSKCPVFLKYKKDQDDGVPVSIRQAYEANNAGIVAVVSTTTGSLAQRSATLHPAHSMVSALGDSDSESEGDTSRT